VDYLQSWLLQTGPLREGPQFLLLSRVFIPTKFQIDCIEINVFAIQMVEKEEVLSISRSWLTFWKSNRSNEWT